MAFACKGVPAQSSRTGRVQMALRDPCVCRVGAPNPRVRALVNPPSKLSPSPVRSVRSVASSAAVDSTPVSSVPVPVVKIDNIHDPFATVVSVKYGTELGELIDTASALRNLGLNIHRAKVRQDETDELNKHKFFVTDAETSEKIVKSAKLELIRMTILECLAKYHPEASALLEAGHRVDLPEQRDLTAPLGPRHRVVVDTTIEMKESETGSYTELFITTKDRPGLLVDIVSVLKDLNVNVVSAEVDTVGPNAEDEFFVTYHGEPLNGSMKKLVENCLQYHLSIQEVSREESY